jgi:Flp pilus assembly protein TadG
MGPDTSQRRRRSGSQGNSLVETTFIVLLLFGLLFLLIDLGWAVFVKATLQQAVRSGVRYAITGQHMTVTNNGTQTTLGQVASIEQVVEQQSMGLISAGDPNGYISVQFYSTASDPPALVTGTGSNAGGNLVVVSVTSYPMTPMAPLLRSGAAIPITVSSGDLLEPYSTPPPL